ncbi:MAG TPA: hypothetical protein VIT38_07470 [Allosphingosinicella sp.]|jgi:hypothetical protein
MKLHGSVEDNLNAAVRSARRLRGQPIYPDTLCYWGELLDHARRDRPSEYPGENQLVGRLIIELEAEMAGRDDEPGLCSKSVAG